ncbi:hypothetical protein G4B88_027899 [Cannabis sativa]|uniref:Uncharacterized protein n=1 Tax=Cannabis sativa TaxID=3483 RepID=A0A7J6I7X6_CANSA|nr:hypothetical protein G4B88_027899 [Cannabis sativa]
MEEIEPLVPSELRTKSHPCARFEDEFCCWRCSSPSSLFPLQRNGLTEPSLSPIPTNILKDCKALQNLSLHGNPISMDQFQQMEGFEEFEARRRKKFDKQIDSNVMISSKGLDEEVEEKQ